MPIQTTNPLPKAEQWLTEIVKSTSPAPKRAPAFNTQLRSKSLAAVDPFEATSLSLAPSTQTTTSYPSTNPFVSPTKSMQQSFQVQL